MEKKQKLEKYYELIQQLEEYNQLQQNNMDLKMEIQQSRIIIRNFQNLIQNLPFNSPFRRPLLFFILQNVEQK